MTHEKLKQLSTEQLLKKEKFYKRNLKWLAGTILIILISATYISIHEMTFHPTVVVGILLTVGWIDSLKRWRWTKRELTRR